MRGTFIDNSMTFQVEISGESWRQGNSISVVWSIEGQLKEDVEVSLALALIDLRKIKKKDPKAIQIVEAIPYQCGNIRYEHSFKLDLNASISDGTWTYSIVCGNLQEPLQLKRLDLTIRPWQTLEEIIKLIENFKRFTLKSIKNKKKSLDAKFSVPSSKEYGAIEGLNILFTRIDNNGHSDPNNTSLSMEFHFKTKKLTYGTAGVETTKSTIVIKRILSEKDYIAFGDSINQDQLLSIFDEVFAEVSQRTRM